jgi:cytochrome c553
VPQNPILSAQYASYLSLALQGYINGDRDYGIMKTMAERLSAGDIQAIAAYYAAQPPYQSQAPTTGDIARGASKAVACSACHGPNGNSVNPEFPRLAGQHATYLAHAIKGYRSGARQNSLMMAVTQALSDADIADIAAYFASQAPQLKETAR